MAKAEALGEKLGDLYTKPPLDKIVDRLTEPKYQDT